MEQPENDAVVANWWLDAKAICQDLGITKPLDQSSDWQTLKVYPFGELAYDREEGLKWETTLEQLKDLVAFVRKFQEERGIEFTFETGRGATWAVFQCQGRWPFDVMDDLSFPGAGLIRSPDYPHEWELVS